MAASGGEEQTWPRWNANASYCRASCRSVSGCMVKRKEASPRAELKEPHASYLMVAVMAFIESGTVREQVSSTSVPPFGQHRPMK